MAEREIVYEYVVSITGVTDFGVGMEAIMSGAALPSEGARIDVAFSGPVKGARIAGSVSGFDYIHVRADGRMQLHIHGVITTSDGARISLFADGVAMPRQGEPNLDLRENGTMFSSDPRYTWVNTIQVWAEGHADMINQTVTIRGYKA